MLSRLPSDVWHYVRDAPGTYLWLVALLVTSRWMATMPAERSARVLAANSTNLARLRRAPLLVLVTSAFFTAGTSWLFYLVTYSVFHAPAEHWLGTWRWLAVIALAHVGATLISQGSVWYRIRKGELPASEREASDYGVSYAQAGAAAVLAWRIPLPWRIAYLVVLIAFYLYGLAKDRRDFTALGHVCAVAIGLCCFWLAP
ncbi:rhomboid-like protein [Catenulispora yoronensis]|uniref:rhomboid-like protein n=1 Tax=Catenulispora yoronensis TaxID=450799 RepID=UPI0031DAC935